MSIKQKLHGVWMVWKIIVIVVLCAILIPLALQERDNGMLFQWVMVLSVLIYVAVSFAAGKTKKKLRKYLNGTAMRLLLAMTLLAVTFVLQWYNIEVYGTIALVGSAILYAFFLQRISFLRVIGL